MNDISKEEWLRIKGQGKVKYILFHWILVVALPMSIILPIIMALKNGFGVSYFTSFKFFTNIFMYFTLFTVLSIVFGILKWKKYDKFYIDYIARNK
ncbi:MAG: hypothetical protein Q8942_09580 [Bacillota bacterium]|nr:hypothetical protein [Bacillota bacterium]